MIESTSQFNKNQVLSTVQLYLCAILLVLNPAGITAILTGKIPSIRLPKEFDASTPYTNIINNYDYTLLTSENNKGVNFGNNNLDSIANQLNNQKQIYGTLETIGPSTGATGPATFSMEVPGRINYYGNFPTSFEQTNESTAFKSIKSVTTFLKNLLKPRYFENTMQYDTKTTSTGLDLYMPFRHGILRSFQERMNTVYPGTVWCGVGNFAPSNASYGIFYMTDQCCKEHDQCPDSIPAKSARHGLRNIGLFSRSHCDCDRDFYLCLKNANTFVSNKIGVAYFNVLRPQCYRMEYPVMKCLSWFDSKCMTYLVDEKQPKMWQWFDNRYF